MMVLIKIYNYKQWPATRPYLVSAVPPECLSQVFVLRTENLFPKSKTRQGSPCPLQPHPTMPSSSQSHPRRERQSATKKQKQNTTIQ